MLGRISKLRERIVALEFSNDETRLAVTLLDGRLMMFSVPDFNLIAQNHDCKDVSYRIDFSVKNQLVTNCFDGTVRIYDAELTLQTEAIPWPSHSVSSVHFSPDGEKILASYYDQQKLVILDADSLFVDRTLQAGDQVDAVLPQAIWSSDGKYVFAGGDVVNNNEVSILRWEVAKNSEPSIFPASKQRIFRLISLPGGDVGYTTLDHAVGAHDRRREAPIFSKLLLLFCILVMTKQTPGVRRWLDGSVCSGW